MGSPFGDGEGATARKSKPQCEERRTSEPGKKKGKPSNVASRQS